jgi:hypothetical protein
VQGELHGVIRICPNWECAPGVSAMRRFRNPEHVLFSSHSLLDHA